MLGEKFQSVHRQAVLGDSAAFAMLWTATNPPLLRYLRVIAGGLAEDVASETWLKVIRSLDTFSGDESMFLRWLVTIARNVYLDHVRKVNRRPETSHPDLAELPIRPGEHAPDPADLVSEQFSTDAAIRLIATLPSEQAELVMLRVVLGLEVGQVAAIVGRSPGAVRVAVHRALRRLQQLLSVSALPVRAAVTDEGERAFRNRDD